MELSEESAVNQKKKGGEGEGEKGEEKKRVLADYFPFFSPWVFSLPLSSIPLLCSL